MTETELFEQSFNIAWNVLIQSEELGEPNAALHQLAATIGEMMKRGERRRLLLQIALSKRIGRARSREDRFCPPAFPCSDPQIQ
jgi:hypothetical protein